MHQDSSHSQLTKLSHLPWTYIGVHLLGKPLTNKGQIFRRLEPRLWFGGFPWKMRAVLLSFFHFFFTLCKNTNKNIYTYTVTLCGSSFCAWTPQLELSHTNDLVLRNVDSFFFRGKSVSAKNVTKESSKRTWVSLNTSKIS